MRVAFFNTILDFALLRRRTPTARHPLQSSSQGYLTARRSQGIKEMASSAEKCTRAPPGRRGASGRAQCGVYSGDYCILDISEREAALALMRAARTCARTKKHFRPSCLALPQRRLSAGQPACGVHNGAATRRCHQGATREGAPRFGDVLDLLLPYGLQQPQRRPRSRGRARR